MKYLKKYWIIILLIIITIIRFLISYNLPSFYLRNLRFDDSLMLNQSTNILSGKYLGEYSVLALVKGPFFPLFLSYARVLHFSYSSFFSFFYILSCIYFIIALKKVINNKYILAIIYIVLLFNPVSFSTEGFQRIYRNSITITELLFFLGAVIHVTVSKRNSIINNIFLGLITSIMLLTREDTIWTYVILGFIYLYKIIKSIKFRDIKISRIIINIIPIIMIIGSLNFVSFLNYKHYNIYTYNELSDTSFKEAYKKVLEIKDLEHIDKVAIPRSTLYKLFENSKVINYSREEIDEFYSQFADTDGEITNGNIVWYFRNLIVKKKHFKDGKEASDFYKEFSKDLDRMFDEGVFEKEFVMPSVYLYVPTGNELLHYPLDFIKTIFYTTTYKNVRTLDSSNINEIDSIVYHPLNEAYAVTYYNYRNAENIVTTNPLGYEIVRSIYMWFTLIFSGISLVIYILNIKVKDNLNIITHIVLLAYLIIIAGISYNNISAFPSIRYGYLTSIYILQSLFIMFNLYRLYSNILLKENSK